MSEGYLRKNAIGRYELNDIELTCGSCLQIKIADQWLPMRIEYDGRDYYLLGAELSFYPKTVHARIADRYEW